MSLCGSAAPNCTPYWEGKDFRRYEAEPDIAGIGVISAFVATSCVTIAIAVVGLVFRMIRGLEDNAIDRLVFSQLQKVSFLRLKDSTFKFWQPILESLVLTLSDQQLLVGISILVTGFIKHCSISVYHFAVISDLAWFSSNTNLTSLNVLQVYLVEHPSLRNWRVCLMLVILVLLLAALAMEGHRSWYESWNSPAQCLFNEFLVKVGGEPGKWMRSQMVLLTYSYTVSMARLFNPDKLDILLYERPLRKMERSIARLQDCIVSSIALGGWISYVTSILLLPAWAFVACGKWGFVALTAIVGSTTVSLCVDIAVSAIGVWGIIDDRNIPKSQMDGNENAWGFGQLIQVLLLSSILLTFKDSYSKQSDKRARRAKKRGQHTQAPNQEDDATAEHSQDPDDSEPAHVTLARADTEAGGRGGGISSTSTQDVPTGHTLVRRTPTITGGWTSGH
ncbi:MAG: hypothetical protein Q9199_002705 [Rusavskia elegans]